MGCGSEASKTREIPIGAKTEGAGGKEKSSATIENPTSTAVIESKPDEISVVTRNEKGEPSKVSTRFDVKDLGIPLYPGSVKTAASPDDLSLETASTTTYLVTRFTDDSPERVVEFFAKHLKDAEPYTFENIATIRGKTKDGDSASVTATKEKESKRTRIAISLERLNR